MRPMRASPSPLASLLCAGLLLTACGEKKAEKTDSNKPTGRAVDGPGNLTLDQVTDGLPAGQKLYAEITTPQGAILCELMPDLAPKTVTAFVGLARGKLAFREGGKWIKDRPFFDGLAFHRVIPDFMIQGGDPLSRTEYSSEAIGSGDPGFTVPDEYSELVLFDVPGRLAMASAGPGTNSAGSQFFITEVPRPDLDKKYTIFGQCDNIDAVKTIARVPREPKINRPLTPVVMTVRILRK
jgi:peptidyl-prolyl cis-trans isomerase A (cyclophilin A)